MLSAEDFHVVDDPDAVRRENELLALENRLLRGRGSETVSREELRNAVDQARREEREKGRAAVHRVLDKHRADTEERRAKFASVPHERLERLTKAESDLQRLVSRLQGSPAGPLLRRWEGWRDLVRRWGS